MKDIGSKIAADTSFPLRTETSCMRGNDTDLIAVITVMIGNAH
jgi:hypothetical protein